jgi:hypothetical protein
MIDDSKDDLCVRFSLPVFSKYRANKDVYCVMGINIIKDNPNHIIEKEKFEEIQKRIEKFNQSLSEVYGNELKRLLNYTKVLKRNFIN